MKQRLVLGAAVAALAVGYKTIDRTMIEQASDGMQEVADAFVETTANPHRIIEKIEQEVLLRVDRQVRQIGLNKEQISHDETEFETVASELLSAFKEVKVEGQQLGITVFKVKKTQREDFIDIEATTLEMKFSDEGSFLISLPPPRKINPALKYNVAFYNPVTKRTAYISSNSLDEIAQQIDGSIRKEFDYTACENGYCVGG